MARLRARRTKGMAPAEKPMRVRPISGGSFEHGRRGPRGGTGLPRRGPTPRLPCLRSGQSTRAFPHIRGAQVVFNERSGAAAPPLCQRRLAPHYVRERCFGLRPPWSARLGSYRRMPPPGPAPTASKSRKHFLRAANRLSHGAGPGAGVGRTRRDFERESPESVCLHSRSTKPSKEPHDSIVPVLQWRRTRRSRRGEPTPAPGPAGHHHQAWTMDPAKTRSPHSPRRDFAPGSSRRPPRDGDLGFLPFLTSTGPGRLAIT